MIYRIISGTNGIEDEVNEALKQGWQLCGGVALAVTKLHDGTPIPHFAQAVTMSEQGQFKYGGKREEKKK